MNTCKQAECLLTSGAYWTLMKHIRISDDAHMKLVNSKTYELTSVSKVIDHIVNNVGTETQSASVDYSKCPNCEGFKEQLDLQQETLDSKNKALEMNAGFYKEEIEKLERQIEHPLPLEKTAQDRINEIKSNGHKIALTNSDDDEEDE